MGDWCGLNRTATQKHLKMRAQILENKTVRTGARVDPAKIKKVFCDGEVFFLDRAF
jgi:hypothetical protein